MAARGCPIFILLVVPFLVAANYRTENFLVTAPSDALAREIGDAAEAYRRELAVDWLGKPLPPWQDVCSIRAVVGAQLPAGGQTSFYFTAGRPRGWDMIVQGSRERILDSVLPHEITHTIFATHFGRPLPRWADEGACTTVEHPSERAKQERWLVEFLTTRPSRGIPFNMMFQMQDYPSDILPLYAQGYAVAEFLIQQGGRRKFVDYVQAGMQSNDWSGATRQFYGYASLSALQVAWLDWIAQGRPVPVPEQLAGTAGLIAASGNNTATATRDAGASAAAPGRDALVSTPVQTPPREALSWYARQRGDRDAQAVSHVEQAQSESKQAESSQADRTAVVPTVRAASQSQHLSRPAGLQRVELLVIEPSHTAPFVPVADLPGGRIAR